MRPITRPMPLRRPNYDRKLARVLVHNLAGNPLTGNNSGSKPARCARELELRDAPFA